jgi:hypothetical protein
VAGAEADAARVVSAADNNTDLKAHKKHYPGIL